MKKIFIAWTRQTKLKMLFLKVNDKHLQILAIQVIKKIKYVT
jgi:hypothetical protein